MKYVLLSIIMLFTFNINVLATKNTSKTFIEKLTNSIDAILMKDCQLRFSKA